MGELARESNHERLTTVRNLRQSRDVARDAANRYYNEGRPLDRQLDLAQAALAVVAFEALRAGIPATTVLEASGFEDERYDRAMAIGQGIAAYLRSTYPTLFKMGAGDG